MQPNQPPPAPPPYQPVPSQGNPYEFITGSGQPVKKSLLPQGGSKTGRIIIFAVAIIVLLIVGVLVIALLGSGGGGAKADYQLLLQQQAEIIRISKLAETKARQAEAKNLAITADLSLTSQQATIASLAKKAGAKTDLKSLAFAKNSQTDTLLTQADQTNQFDGVFIKTMKTQLTAYQKTIKKIYDEATKPATKDILKKDYDAASALIGEQKQ